MNKLLWLVVTLIILTQIFGGGVVTQRKHDQMLFTVVTVDGVGSGSGVVIHSKDNFTLILTAKHVVKKMDEVDITFHPDGQEYHAIVVKVSKKRDLALLMVEGYTHPYVATLSTDLKPKVYTKVWKVGGGMRLPTVLKGEDNPRAITTCEEVIEIRSLHKQGVRILDILPIFPQLNRDIVSSIVNRRTWKHI